MKKSDFWAADLGFSPDGKSVFLQGQGSLSLWNADTLGASYGSDLPTLMVQGCDWLQPYLAMSPDVGEQDRELCSQKLNSETFESIEYLSPEQAFDANQLANICWNANILGLYTEGLSLCERAVEIAQAENYSASQVSILRSSRGTSRALNGDINGAISDFLYYVQESSSSENSRQTRREWINSLRTGISPEEIFTPEVLEDLRPSRHQIIY